MAYNFVRKYKLILEKGADVSSPSNWKVLSMVEAILSYEGE